MMIEGLKAMVLGMGMVYVFLVIMIFLMNIMAKVLAPFANALEKPVAAPKKKAEKKSDSAALSAGDRILALAAIEAVKMHRGDSK